MDRKALALTVLFILMSGAVPAADALKLRVIAEQANVHLKSNRDSDVLATVPNGAFLESIQREEGWYIVVLPADDKGFKHIGYIRSEEVEVVQGREEVQEDFSQDFSPSEPHVGGPKKLFSGFLIKFGWMRSPDAGGLAHSWVTGLNFDIGLGRHLALGIEIMPAYRNYSEIDLQVFPVLGFVNLKAGFNAGDLVRPLGFMSPYAGVGPGLEAAYNIAGLEGESFTQFSTHFAYHIFMGLQLNLGAVLLMGEYQWVRVSDPYVDPDFWRHYLLVGLRFRR